jgi:hypothetical protein
VASVWRSSQRERERERERLYNDVSRYGHRVRGVRVLQEENVSTAQVTRARKAMNATGKNVWN